MVINVLPDEIVNQIAAGEVIENPAAVIKELVENSLDAGSTQIDIVLEHAGFTKIQVVDNGCGISKEDLLKAPLRHATSKIKNFDDLYHINSMGFRGEALASIFSIAKTKIISQQEGKQAYEISSQDTSKVKLSSAKQGTTILVEDLFYNTPARKKYLRSENLELKAVMDIMRRFEVYYSHISFSVKHNGKLLLSKPSFQAKVGDLDKEVSVINQVLQNLYHVFGSNLQDNLFYVEKEIPGLKVLGFISKPSSLSYATKKNQFFFVNGRYVRSKVLQQALYEGYSTNLMEGRHPFYALFIDIDPEMIDVNIHPTKIELKFENELEMFETLKSAIFEIFEQEESFKKFESQKVEDKQKTFEDKSIHTKNILSNKRPYTQEFYTRDTQRQLNVAESESDYGLREAESDLALPESNFSLSDSVTGFSQDSESESQSEPLVTSHNFEDLTGNPDRVGQKELPEEKKTYGPLYETLKEYRILGQINKTFVIIETPKEMILLDQHVIEEKFYYEMFKHTDDTKKVETQKLLSPKVLSMSPSEMFLFKEHKELLEKFGFEVEEFGERELVVRTVPINLRKQAVAPELVADIIHEISQDKKFIHLEEERLEKLASMSCKASIKAGRELTHDEIVRMIENLKTLKEPFNCPHGRPIMLRYSFGDLEKKFGRVN